MKILVACEDPRIPTGFGNVSRFLCDMFSNQNEVYSIAFNNSDCPNHGIIFNNYKVIPNLELKRNSNASYGSDELINFYDKIYNFDLILFCNDSHRFRYINYLNEGILSRSIYLHISEAEEIDILAMDYMKKCSDFIFSCSYSKNIHKEIKESNNRSTIPIPIDVDNFSPASEQTYKSSRSKLKLDNKFIVLRVDRNQPRKQWVSTLRAFSIFAQDKDDVILYCKCDINDPAANYDLPSIASRLNIGDKIRFDGEFIERKSICEKIYKAADTFLSTTSGEGLGLSLCEAGLCELPIISTDAGPIREFLGDKAILVPPLEKDKSRTQNYNIPNEKAVADELNKLYEDYKFNNKNKNKEIGQETRKHILSYFSKYNIVSAWKNVISSLLSLNKSVFVYGQEFQSKRTISHKRERNKYLVISKNIKFPKEVDVVDKLISALEDNPSSGIAGCPIRRDTDLSGPISWLDGTCIAMREEDAKVYNINDKTTAKEFFYICTDMLSKGKYIVEVPISNISNYQLNEKEKQDIKNNWGTNLYNKIKIAIHCDLSTPNGLATWAIATALNLNTYSFDIYINDISNSDNKWTPIPFQQLIEKTKKVSFDKSTWNFDMINFCFLPLQFSNDLSCGLVKICFMRCENQRISKEEVVACCSIDRIVVMTDIEKQLLVSSGVTIPIHVVPPVFLPINKSLNKKDIFTFFTTCNDVESIGIKRVVEAFRDEFRGQHDVRLLIRVNKDLKDTWLSSLPPVPRVSLYSNYGKKSYEDIYEELVSYSAYIQPSGFGMSTVALESSYYNLPVIFPKGCGSESIFGKSILEVISNINNDNLIYDKDLLRNSMREVFEKKHTGQVKRNYDLIRDIDNKKCFVGDLIPLLFSMKGNVDKSLSYKEFNPLIIRNIGLKPVQDNDYIDIVIPTKDRRQYLCSLLSSLLCQTYKLWNLIIVCDDKDESIITDTTIQSLLSAIRVGNHSVLMIRGNRKGPHFSHQKALESANSDLIFRIDDDCILHPECLDILKSYFISDVGCRIGAVGPLVLSGGKNENEQKCPVGYEEMSGFSGKAFDPKPNLQTYIGCGNGYDMEVEHLYSSFMYRKECAKGVGGYCLDYSKAGFREETDLTYRMKLSGWKLLVVPSAKIYHLSAPYGGVRDIDNEYFKSDDQLYKKRYISFIK
ncbi:MAG: glycosyltransferase [Nanoarchaeota archaeon]